MRFSRIYAHLIIVLVLLVVAVDAVKLFSHKNQYKLFGGMNEIKQDMMQVFVRDNHNFGLTKFENLILVFLVFLFFWFPFSIPLMPLVLTVAAIYLWIIEPITNAVFWARCILCISVPRRRGCLNCKIVVCQLSLVSDYEVY